MEKKIIWIDENINNIENKKTLEIFKKELKNYNFHTFISDKSAISEIKSNKIFHFYLFYVIVSGRLAESFFNDYVQIVNDYPIIAATIVYCYHKDFHENKPYNSDTFLNPGKIVTSYKEVIEYIQKDECNWKNNMNISTEVYHEENYFGFSFEYADSLSKIMYPIYLPKLLNSTHIESSDVENLQNFLLKYFPGYKHLIKPSQEKNIFIPYHLLAKFLLRFYTVEELNKRPSFHKCMNERSSFYKCMNERPSFYKCMNERPSFYKCMNERPSFYKCMNERPSFYKCMNERPSFYKCMNIDLSNDNCDKYKTFIFLMFNALNKNTIKNYNGKLYRGGALRKEEFDKLEEIYNKSKESKNKEINISYIYSKSFLSFSKDKHISNTFIKFNDKNVVPIKYILHPNSNRDFMCTNLNIEKLSMFENEKEVLILPMTSFEIINIKDKKYKNKEYKEIHLSYLSKHKKRLDEHLKALKESEKMQSFYNDIINSPYGKEISKIFGQKINEDLKKYLEQATTLKIDLDHRFYNNHVKEKPEPRINPNAKCSIPGYSNGKQLNELFKSEPVSLQAVKFTETGNPALFLEYKDGSSTIMKNFGTKDGKYVVIKEFNENHQLGFSKCALKNNGNKIEIQGVTTQEILMNLEKNNNMSLTSEACISAATKDSHALAIERNNYSNYNICGSTIGHFLANIDKFVKSSNKDKLITLGMTSAPVLMYPMTKKIPVIGNSILACDFVYHSYKDLTSDSLNKSEMFMSLAKNISSIALDIGLNTGFVELGTIITYSIGIASGPGVVVFGLVGGLFGGLISGLFNRYLNSSLLTLNSDCLYYKYIPYKFRTKTNPNLKWNNVSNDTKSFVVEMVDDLYNCRWLVLNIPSDIREIKVDNKIGDTVIEYKGIPDNYFKIFYNIYEIKSKKIKYEDWQDTKKMLKQITHVATLEVN